MSSKQLQVYYGCSQLLFTTKKESHRHVNKFFQNKKQVNKQTFSETASTVANKFAFIKKSLVMTSKIVLLVRLRLSFSLCKSNKSSCS